MANSRWLGLMFAVGIAAASACTTNFGFTGPRSDKGESSSSQTSSIGGMAASSNVGGAGGMVTSSERRRRRRHGGEQHRRRRDGEQLSRGRRWRDGEQCQLQRKHLWRDGERNDRQRHEHQQRRRNGEQQPRDQHGERRNRKHEQHRQRVRRRRGGLLGAGRLPDSGERMRKGDLRQRLLRHDRAGRRNRVHEGGQGLRRQRDVRRLRGAERLPGHGVKCATATCNGNNACVKTDAWRTTACSEAGGSLCDGNGKCVACLMTSDCPLTGTACATAACTGDACVNTNAANRVKCSDNGGSVCNGAGLCVQCNVTADCTGTLGCVSEQVRSASCTDKVQNGTETDVDCGGPTAWPARREEHASSQRRLRTGYCRADVCAAPSCSDGVLERHRDRRRLRRPAASPSAPTARRARATATVSSGNCFGGACLPICCNGQPAGRDRDRRRLRRPLRRQVRGRQGLRRQHRLRERRLRSAANASRPAPTA